MKPQHILLNDHLKEKFKPRTRVRGRYNSSELWGIVNGRTTPQDWLNPPEKDVKSMVLMWKGIEGHEMIEKLLPPEMCEVKKEHVFERANHTLTLVAKADFLPDDRDEVIDFKTSDGLMEQAKPWALEQVKVYASIFERSFGSIYQPVVGPESGLWLKDLGRVARDDKWFEEQLNKLFIFHLQVEALYEQQQK